MPLTKINESNCSLAGPIFLKYWRIVPNDPACIVTSYKIKLGNSFANETTGSCSVRIPFFLDLDGVCFYLSIFFFHSWNKLNKLARGHTGRISAVGLLLG